MANSDKITLGQLNTAMKTVKNYVDDKVALSGGGGESADLSAFVSTVKTNNLYDYTKTSTAFTDNNGTTVAASTAITGFIETKKGRTYSANQSCTYYFFNASKVCQSQTTQLAYGRMQSPIDGYVVIKFFNTSSTHVVVEGTDPDGLTNTKVMISEDKVQPISKWYGKKWLAIGDSITTDNGDYATEGYVRLISRELGMTATNVAISGKQFPYFYPLIDNYANDYNLITVMLGTNDHGFGCALGTLNDGGTYDGSFYGRVQNFYAKLRNKYPNAVIIFLTPIRRSKVDDQLGGANDSHGEWQRTGDSLTVEKFRDAIIDVMTYNANPYVDLYNAINPRNQLNRIRYFCTQASGTNDGTHPNNVGHALFLAPIIRDAILKYEPYI